MDGVREDRVREYRVREDGPRKTGGVLQRRRDCTSPGRPTTMNRAEALRVMGLSPGPHDTVELHTLRAAYKRALLRAHPDKPGGSPERFAQLRQAHAVLLSSGASGGPGGPGGEGLDRATLEKMMERIRQVVAAVRLAADISRRAFFSPPPAPRPAPPEEGGQGGQGEGEGEGEGVPSIELDVEVTLEDAFVGRTKRIVVRVDDNGTFVSQALLLPLVPFSPLHVFEGVGDHAALSRARGDVIVRLRVAPHPVFRIDDTVSPFDLHASVDVPLVDVYYSRASELTHMDGSSIRLDSMSPGVQVVRGRGMPFLDESGLTVRGDLYVFRRVVAPRLSRAHLGRPEVRAAFATAFLGVGSQGGESLADVHGDGDDHGLEQQVGVFEVECDVLGDDGGDWHDARDGESDDADEHVAQV